MDKRTILAVVLSFLVFLVFTFLGQKYGSKETPKTPPPKTAESTQAAKPAPAQPPAPSPAPQKPRVEPQAPPRKPSVQPPRPAREVVVETDLYRAVFTEQGASLKSFQLKKYWQKLPFETISRFGIGPVIGIRTRGGPSPRSWSPRRPTRSCL
jgi:YidC/Oxa1 family membrane protein insertase